MPILLFSSNSVLGIQVNDSIQVSENFTSRFPLAQALVFDTTTIAETVALSTSTAAVRFISVFDSVNVAENAKLAVTSFIAIADSVTVNEKDGYALDFDGVSAKVDITPVAAQNNLGAVTISVWYLMRSYGTSVFPRLFHKGPNANGYFDVGFDSSQGVLSFLGQFATTPISRNILTPSLNVVHHLLITYDGGTLATGIHIYIDGNEAIYSASTDAVGARSADSTDLAIGNRTIDNARPFDGIIDEARYYNRVVTVGERRDLFRADNNVPTTGMVGYWAFEEGTGVTTADSTGNANGTLVGTVLPQWVFSTFGINKSVKVQENFLPNVFDSVVVSEFVTDQENLLDISIVDNLTLAETVTSRLPSATISIFDNLTVGETLTTKLGGTIFVSDNVVVAETVTSQPANLVASIFDSVTVAEQTPTQLVVNRSVFDSIQVSESVSFSSLQRIISVFDSVVVSENATSQLVINLQIGVEAIDQQSLLSNANAGFGIFASPNVRYRGQGFVPNTPYLTAIAFARVVGSQGVKVYIDTADVNSQPLHALGSELYSFVIPNSQLNAALTKYSLPVPLAVTPGSQYVFYLAPWNVAGDIYTDDYNDWRIFTGIVYAGGKEIYNANGVWATEVATAEFTIYGQFNPEPMVAVSENVFGQVSQATTSDQVQVSESITTQRNNYQQISDNLTVAETVAAQAIPQAASVFDSATVGELVTAQENLLASVADKIKVQDQLKNLVPNPSFEVGITAWGLDADFTRITSDSFSGSASIKQVSPANFANFTSDNTGIPVAQNTSYTLSFYYKLAITSGLGPVVDVNVGSVFGTTLVGASLGAQANWTRFTITFNTGANSTIYIRIFNNGGNVTAFYDAFQVEAGSVVTPYFDGSVAGSKWEGTANQSISDQNFFQEQVVDNPSVFDSVAVTENIGSGTVPYSASVADSIAVSENITTQPKQLVNVFDSITVAENELARISIQKINIFDSIAVSEFTANGTLARPLSVVDNITVGENIASQRAIGGSTFDSLKVADSASGAIGLQRLVSDQIQVSEDVQANSAASGPFSSATGYGLDFLALKPPKTFVRQWVYLKTDYTTLTGKTTRDVSSLKEKFVLTFQYLTAKQVADLMRVIDKNVPVLFEVKARGVITISEMVFPFVGAITYSTPGSDYRASLQLELIVQQQT